MSDSCRSELDSRFGLVKFSGGRAYCSISGGLSSPAAEEDAAAAALATAAWCAALSVETEKEE